MTVSDEYVDWRKSSRSKDSGECVEAGWRKSSYSESHHECVEVGGLSTRIIGIRDSKAGERSPILEFDASEWRQLVTLIKEGSHTRSRR